MTSPEMIFEVRQAVTCTEKTGKKSSETSKRKMMTTRNNVVIAKSNMPTLTSGHIYSEQILRNIKEQAENHSGLYCAGIPSTPGKLILSDICYQAKNFRIEEDSLLCDLHRLKVNEHIDTTDSHIYFHVYGVGDINKENQVTDFILLGICTYSEPIYPT